jgi:ADP-ribose pyrophosphatase
MSNDHLAWKQLETKTVYQDKWFHAMADSCMLPDGRIIEPYYKLGVPNWTNMVVFTQNDEMVLVKQYRYPINTVTLELPGGTIDMGEDAKAACIREMQEETGYTSNEVEFLFSVAPNPALQSNTAYFFMATNAIKNIAQQFDPFEEIEVALYNKQQVKELLANNSIQHGVQIGAIYAAMVKKGWMDWR